MWGSVRRECGESVWGEGGWRRVCGGRVCGVCEKGVWGGCVGRVYDQTLDVCNHTPEIDVQL